MIVSNALPIQFWPVDESTYNETENCGVEYRCWCQPWQCDDEIQIQVTAEGDEDVADYSPAVLNSEGVIVHTPFTFGASGYYFFVPDIFDICDGQYSIIIYDATSEYTESVEQMNLYWHNVVNIWTYGAESAEIEADTAATGKAISLQAGETLGLSVTVTISDGVGGPWGGNFTFIALLVDQFGAAIASQQEVISSGGVNGTFEQFVQLTVPIDSAEPAVEIRIAFQCAPTPFAPHVLFETDSSQIMYIGGQAITHKSDCLDIRSSQECTELITYSNNKDFAGLRYEGMSPVQTFTIRVPAVFVHEEFPQEEEVHPLSNDTFIRLSGRMERKRLLDLGYMPYYMHQKMLLILMHDNIEIQGNQWKKRDAYNIEDSSKRFPKRKANVMLTDKNFIVRNLI